MLELVLEAELNFAWFGNGNILWLSFYSPTFQHYINSSYITASRQSGYLTIKLV